MVTTNTTYDCDICEARYKKKEDAERCEAKGIPEPHPIGLVYGDHSKGAFYEGITFAIAKSSVDGHYAWGSAWACRDNGAGDNLADGDYCEGRPSGRHRLDTNAPHFKRMISHLKSVGITPLVCVGDKIIPYKAKKGQSDDTNDKR